MAGLPVEAETESLSLTPNPSPSKERGEEVFRHCEERGTNDEAILLGVSSPKIATLHCVSLAMTESSPSFISSPQFSALSSQFFLHATLSPS